MNKAFYATLILHAKNELSHMNYLLVRANSGFFAERSIDQAIEHLQLTKDYLLKAKQSYISTRPPTQNIQIHNPLPDLESPRKQSYLS
jgi:hypothetical protein